MGEFVRQVMTGVSVAAILAIIGGLWRTASLVRQTARAASGAAQSATEALTAVRAMQLGQVRDRERLRSFERDLARLDGPGGGRRR